MLRNSKNIKEFKENLKKLRKTAIDKLEDCRVDSDSLLKFLNKFDLSHLASINDIKNQNKFIELTKISKKIH